jgi:hypothetical protein
VAFVVALAVTINKKKYQLLLGIEHWLSVTVQTEPGYNGICFQKGEYPGFQNRVMIFLPTT